MTGYLVGIDMGTRSEDAWIVIPAFNEEGAIGDTIGAIGRAGFSCGTDIVLALKRLRVRFHTDDPKVLTIEKKGPGTVTGADPTPDPGPLEVLRGRPVVLWTDADPVGDMVNLITARYDFEANLVVMKTSDQSRGIGARP